MKFTEFQLNEGLLSGIGKAGYETCMPVQAQVLTKALDGADLYVQSQTGTGKTAAYLITIIQRLVSDETLKGKKALIMVPTRELAVQVEDEARALCVDLPLKIASFYGGVGYKQQQEQLKNGVDILVGTPGRVIDLQDSGSMDLREVSFLVVDEADRMFDMGFYPDLRTLIKVLPAANNRQTMLFSATLNTWVKNLAWEYTIDAVEINIEPENMTVTEIDQELFHVSADNKVRLLLGIMQRENPESIIVFCNTKRMCEVLAKRLKLNGIETEFIIGDLPQTKRLQVIESFKRRSLKCLVATDVAARGIDVNDLAMVVNYDLPNEAENYVHRIGRTARAGKSGKAYTLCCEQDVYNLTAIEKYIEAKIPASVAWEDMYAEDKSAGVYIRTEFGHDDYNHYDDDDRRGRGHSGDRGGRRDDRGGHNGNRGGRSGGRYDDRGGRRDDRGGHRDDRKNSAPRDASAQRSASAPRSANGNFANRDNNQNGADRRRKPAGEPFKRNRKERPNAAGNDASFVRDESERLAELSFEERMAVYKSKYGATASAATKQPSGRKQKNNGKNRTPAPNAKNSMATDTSHKAGQKSKSYTGNRRNYNKTAAPVGKTATTPAKKTGGVTGFFKRLFGKK